MTHGKTDIGAAPWCSEDLPAQGVDGDDEPEEVLMEMMMEMLMEMLMEMMNLRCSFSILKIGWTGARQRCRASAKGSRKKCVRARWLQI